MLYFVLPGVSAEEIQKQSDSIVGSESSKDSFFCMPDTWSPAAAKSLQSCLTLCDPINGGPPGSSVPGILRQEYWSGLPFPSLMHACMLSRFSPVQLCVTLWTAAHQAPLSTGFSRQEYWSGLPFPSPDTWSGRTLRLLTRVSTCGFFIWLSFLTAW